MIINLIRLILTVAFKNIVYLHRQFLERLLNAWYLTNIIAFYLEELGWCPKNYQDNPYGI